MADSPLSVSVQQLAWLQALLLERTGLPIGLDCADGFIVCRLPGELTAVRVKHDARFYSKGWRGDDLGWWRPEREGWSLPFGEPLPTPGFSAVAAPLVESGPGWHEVRYDVLGLAYWALTRVEEVGAARLDEFGRFPASESHAGRFGYLDRPVVDEWFCLLTAVLARAWPAAKLTEHRYSIRLSHDVDRPCRDGFVSLAAMPRKLFGDIAIRRDVKGASRTIGAFLGLTDPICGADPFNTFDWIMDQSERIHTKSTFFFIAGRTDKRRDARYDIGDPPIRALISRIHQRGHRIGLHPSFDTFLRPELIVDEAVALRNVCASLGIALDHLESRMHYLRWRVGVTWRGLNDAGIACDNTIGYPETPGFRCGSCIEFPGFDPVHRIPMGVRIRPLIVMDQTLLSTRYMACGQGDAAAALAHLKAKCRAVGGCFNVLWHNSELYEPMRRAVYLSLLES